MSQPQFAQGQVSLLPLAFTSSLRLRRVFIAWFVVVSVAISVLGSVSAVLALRMRRTRHANEQLAAAAIPLMNLRRDVIRQRAENHKRSQWCDIVESARPSDDALQTLAAIAIRTDPQILIDTVHLRLPVEYTGPAESMPQWATPTLELSARIPQAKPVARWIQELTRSDRIHNMQLQDDDLQQTKTNSARISSDATQRVNLAATPLASGVLP